MLFNAVLPGVVLLGLVIFVHELGHFLMAKWRGVKVLKFSLGFGPALFSVTRGETEYRVSWVPLGGYVQMAGDSPGPDGTMPGGENQFLSHPWYGRVLICLAGPAANLLTAFVVMVTVGLVGVSYPDYPNRLGAVPDTSVAYRAGLRPGDAITAVNSVPVKTWVQIFFTNSKQPRGKSVDVRVERGERSFVVPLAPEQREPFFSSLQRPAVPPVVGSVVTGMPAYKAGLKEGDWIVAVNGRPVTTWDELPRALRGTVDHPVRLRVKRAGREFDVVVTPINPDGRDSRNARIGIEPPYAGVFLEHHGLLESIDLGFRATVSMVGSVYGGLWLTISRPLYYREYVGGPLFIAQAASEQARRGLDAYLQFLAMINIAIMAFNLLPLPVLDGGHVLLALIEAVRRQSISARAYLTFQKVGLVVMGTLFVLILANDPLRLVQRQRALEKAPRGAAPAPTPTSHPAPRERPLAPAPP